MKISTHSIIFCILLNLQSEITQALVILVHGTFSCEENWCKPNGKFYTILEKQACFLNHKLVPFTWSGSLSHKARVQAAECLARIILSYEDEPIIVVGHSHGGNIINLASQVLSEINEVTPSIFPSGTAVFLQAYRNTVSKSSTIKKKKNYIIERVYLLGTPIDQKNYAPNMKIIEHLYNFYSPKDSIQTVLGSYSRCIQKLERAINFQITLHNGIESYHPSHEQMHDPLIAQWILSIPYQLKKLKKGGFEDFQEQNHSTIHFTLEDPPMFECDIHK